MASSLARNFRGMLVWERETEAARDSETKQTLLEFGCGTIVWEKNHGNCLLGHFRNFNTRLSKPFFWIWLLLTFLKCRTTTSFYEAPSPTFTICFHFYSCRKSFMSAVAHLIEQKTFFLTPTIPWSLVMRFAKGFHAKNVCLDHHVFIAILIFMTFPSPIFPCKEKNWNN